jgi:hypothetical protein
LTNYIARRRTIMLGPAQADGLPMYGFVEAIHGTISTADPTDRSSVVLIIGLSIPAAVDAPETTA